MTAATSTPDFAAFFLADEARIDITLPNGEPMLYPTGPDGQQVTVVVYGPSAAQYITAKDRLDKLATTRVFAAMGNKTAKKHTDPSADEADTDFLAAITKRIENFPFPGGPAAVYADKRLKYMADQVRGHQADLGNFFAPSLTS